MRIGYVYGSASPKMFENLKVSKTFQGDRSQLQSALNSLQKGDYLIVSSVTDIGDTVEEILRRVHNWKSKYKIYVASITQDFNSKKHSSFAADDLIKIERELKARQAKRDELRRRRSMIRSRKLHPHKYLVYIEQGYSQSYISKRHGISKRQLTNLANLSRRLYPERWAEMARNYVAIGA